MEVADGPLNHEPASGLLPHQQYCATALLYVVKVFENVRCNARRLNASLGEHPTPNELLAPHECYGTDVAWANATSWTHNGA